MRRALVLASALLLLLAACGDAASTPKDSLVGAIRSLEDYGALTVTLSLNSDVASLQAAAAEDEGMPADIAQKILDSSLTISTRGDSPEDAEGHFLLTIAGIDALDVRTFPDSAFVRVDVPAIAEAFQGDPAALEDFEKKARAMGLTFVEPALRGEWLEIKGFQQLMQQVNQFSQANQAQQVKAFEQFAEAVQADATVTAGDKEGPGTHLAVSLSLRDTYQKFIDYVGGAAGTLPPGSFAPVSEIPDENVSFDTWVDGNRLTQVEFDFLQIGDIAGEEVPAGVDRLGLRLTFEEFTGAIERPSGAVAIDLQEIMGLFLGGMEDAFSGSSGTQTLIPEQSTTAFPCEFLKGEPRRVLLQFKDECPELLEK